MTSYKYQSTDLLSGAVLCDDLPLNVQSFSMQLNGSGTLTAALDLNEDFAVNIPYVNALTPRRSVLWVIADNFPVWAGIVWDWPDMTRQDGTLQISAQTLDSLWGFRLITDTLEYPAVDLFTAFADLTRYGMTKNSSFIEQGVSPPATRDPAYLALFATQGRVARFTIPDAGLSGSEWTASYTYSDLTQVSSAWSDMCSSGNLEYAFTPGLDEDGELIVSLQLGFTALGRPQAETGVVLTYPGNALDYGWTVTGSQSANLVWATAPPNGQELQWQSLFPAGADLTDLASFPVLESTVSWQGSNVTSQAQINTFANGQVALLTGGMTTPTVNVGGSGFPPVQQLRLGDGVLLSFTSDLHPPGQNKQPGVEQEVRITAVTVYPPGPQQSEYMQLTTSAVVAA